ncbi:HEAT repeat domain-containing protein [Halorientalis halophila]|uniref:HEAT repeat domain-containing protein n=1 Tax=Halorientalis halophila TaxID=3108499 RepID=UPI003009DDD7
MTDFAMESARGRAPEEDADPLTETRIRDRLSVDDPRTRRDAVLALVDRASEAGLAPETRERLVEVARGDDDPDVRQFAVEALGAAGGSASAVVTALDDADEWVRAEAVVALSRVDGDVAGPLRAAVEDDSGWVRRNAVIALGKREAASWDLLVDRLKNDPHSPSREYAATFLPDYVDEAGEDLEGGDAEGAGDVAEAVRLLAAVLARDPDAFVRAKAAVSLGDLGTGRAREALEEQGLGDRSDDVQRAAKRALARARGEDPEEVDVSDCGPDVPGGELAPSGAGSHPDAPGGGRGNHQPSGPGPSPSREGFGGSKRPRPGDGPGGPGY